MILNGLKKVVYIFIYIYMLKYVYISILCIYDIYVYISDISYISNKEKDKKL